MNLIKQKTNSEEKNENSIKFSEKQLNKLDDKDVVIKPNDVVIQSKL